jgi:hypothetical protein
MPSGLFNPKWGGLRPIIEAKNRKTLPAAA